MTQPLARFFLVCSLVAAFGIVGPRTANAAYIPSLYNTGVDSLHAPLPLYTSDPNYDLIASADPSCPTSVAPVVLDFPFVWVGTNNAISGWIRPNYVEATGAPNPNLAGICVNGTYIYRTTFTLPTAADVASANIFGQYASDDASAAIRLNGVGIPAVPANYATYTPFTIPLGSPFVLGTNTLDFEIQNLGGPPTGLRVEMNSVPEPTSIGLLVSGGAIALVALRRRRKA